MYKLKNIFTGEERYVEDEEVSSFDKRTWKMLAFAEDAIAIEMQIVLSNRLPRAISIQQLIFARNTKEELREALTEPCTRCPRFISWNDVIKKRQNLILLLEVK